MRSTMAVILASALAAAALPACRGDTNDHATNDYAAGNPRPAVNAEPVAPTPAPPVVNAPDNTPGNARGGGPAAGTPAPANAGMTDGDIAGVLTSTDNAEIAAGTYARAHATSPAVRDFAGMMVTAHTDNRNQASVLLQRLNITMGSSAASQQVVSSNKQGLTQLQGLHGAAFDRAYVDAQVRAHKETLDALDHQILPAVHNGEFRSALQGQVRTLVLTHLQHAQGLRNDMGMGGQPRDEASAHK